MANYYVSQGGSRILNATRVDQSGADNTNVIDWVKTNDFIIAININSNGKDTEAAQYKLRWRDTDGGSFADVGSATEINYNATTDLVNGDPIAVGGRKCDSQGGDTWAAGEEVEGASISDSIDLADEYETEIHFALDCSGATDAKEYEFELYDSTLGVTRGTCGATITMAAVFTKEFTVDAILHFPGWLSDWSYRKEISITGQSGAGTNFQVDLDIGDSAGGDFHLEGNCTNFPQDIQVTDNDGTTLLDYWIEDITADPLKMWVEVADDLGTNQTIYIYYGKGGATTDSDIGATFLFGDDFPGSSLDTGKWTSVGTPTLAISDSIINIFDTDASNASYIKSNTAFSDPAIIEIRQRDFTDEIYSLEFGVGDYVTNAIKKRIATADKYTLTGYKAGSQTSDPSSLPWLDIDDNYHIFKLNWVDGNSKLFKDEVEQGSITTNVPIIDLPLTIGNTRDGGVSGNDCEGSVDWVFVRKYNATEPAFSSAGSEQTPGAAAETKEFTIDAILEATETKEFSIDSILEATGTKEFTADSYLVDRLIKEFTTDAHLQATNTKECSIDALLSTTETKEFTLDSILVSTGTKEFTTDAILEATFTKEFSIDAVLSGTATKEFTIDSILQATESKEFTTDSLLVDRFTKEFTTDSVLVNRLIKEFTTDSLIVDRLTKDFTINGLLLDQFTKEFSINALLQATNTKEFTIDSILEATETKEFTTDSILQATNTKTFSIDSVLTGGISKEFTINALLKATNTKDFTVNSILEATETKEFSADGYLVDRLDKTSSINSILRATESKEFTIDAIVSGTATKEFTVNALLETTNTKDFTTDSILVNRFTKEFTADATLITSNNNKRRSVVGIFPVPDGSLNQLDRKHAAGFYRGPTYPLYSKLFTVDAVLVATQTKTFTTDGYLVDRLDKTFTTDAVLQATETKDFSINALLQATNIKDFSIDSILEATETKEYTIDSILVNRFTKPFTVDAILVTTESKEFTINAILTGTATKEFTVDSLLKTTNTKEFSVDAHLHSTETKDFTIDSILVRTSTKSYTIDALLQTTNTKTFNIDAVIILYAVPITQTLSDTGILTQTNTDSGILTQTNTDSGTISQTLEVT